MNRITAQKIALLLGCLMIGCLLTSGCATIPPQPITGLPSASPTEDAQETSAPAESPDAGVDNTTAPESQPAQTALPPAAAVTAPTNVELFYSGMSSLMGFADASQVTIYESAMDALSVCAGLCWPSATVSQYRYSMEYAKEDMLLAKEQIQQFVGAPSFYLDNPMTRTPSRLKPEGKPLIAESENMNEPMSSFFDITGKRMPPTVGTQTGTPVAVTACGTQGDTLAVIATDLHELRTDDGALLTVLNDHLEQGRTIGVAVITSEFAGYIPDVGVNGTTYVWGSPPTGTLDYRMDYGEYSVGISIDPEQRTMATRPFYLLTIGEQSAVRFYLETLEERLTRELSTNRAFTMETAIFGGSPVSPGYSMGGNMRYIAGQGVTAIPEPTASGGVNLIELKASQQTRYVEWELSYTVHPSDPRGIQLSAEDFAFHAQAVPASGGDSITLSNIHWQVLSAQGDQITLLLRLEFPPSILPQGSYTLQLQGSLSSPDDMPGLDWLTRYGYDADGAQLFEMEQNTVAFDGSRTLFLSRMIDMLGKASQSHYGIAPLGIVDIALTVYA